ncbi:MAG: hypothetical protein IJT24_05030 [Lachnospiraceae bacterium]|nr:hypothetical protein [Lachnospiraceae bacterium]
MSMVEKKLRKLFDYQKFEKEPELQGVIDGAESEYNGVRKLTDDELEFAAGGVAGGLEEDDPQANGRCRVKDCGSYLRRTPYGYVCSNPSCGAMYDKAMNRLDSDQGNVFGMKFK